MDFLQSMGYSKVSKIVSSSGSLSSLKLGNSLVGLTTNQTNNELSKIKNNLGLPILIKIVDVDSDYKILNNNKSEKIKQVGKYTIKFVIPFVDNRVYFEKGKKITINIDVESNKKYEILDYMAKISGENKSFYSEQRIKMKSIENGSKDRSKSLSGGNNL